jgi:hypothetical protein
MTHPPAPAIQAATLTLLSLAGIAAGAAWWLGLVRPARARREEARMKRLAWRGTAFGSFLDARLFPEGEEAGGEDAEARDRLVTWLAGCALFLVAPPGVAELCESVNAGLWWVLAASCGWWAGALVPEPRAGDGAREVALAWLPFGLHVATAVAALGVVLAAAGREGALTQERLASWTLFAALGGLPVGLLVLWVTWDRRRRAEEQREGGLEAESGAFAGFERIPPAPLRELEALLAADPGEARDPALSEDAEAALFAAISWEEAVPWEGEEEAARGPSQPLQPVPKALSVEPRDREATARALRAASLEEAVPWDDEDEPPRDGPRGR